MFVGIGLQARVFRARRRSPDLCPAEEEALFGCEAVDILRPLALNRLFVCGISDGQSAKVTDAFPQHQLAVLVQAGLNFVAVELLHDAFAAGVEVFLVFWTPPVLQVALAIEFRTLVVKAMADLVANHGTHAPIVHGVVSVGVVEGWLKNTGRKDNLIESWIVVGVDGRWRHAPLTAIDGLADLGELPRFLKLASALDVSEVAGPLDPVARIVAPLVGVPDKWRDYS